MLVNGELNCNPESSRIICSGALFYSRITNRFLLLQKAYGKHQGTWGLVGGTNLQDENPWQGLQREIVEEIGFSPDVIKTVPLETFISTDKVFNFHTYLCIIDHEFLPVLSNEHCAWAWCSIDYLPRPMHQGLKNSLNNKIIRTKLQTIFQLIKFL